MNKKFIYTSISALFLSALLFASGIEGGKSNKDLVKFSHEAHSEAAACLDCHSSVPASIKLTDNLLPTMENCAQCHDVEAEDNCNLCHFENVLEPLTQSSSDIQFNHSLHSSEDKPNCESCHNDISTVDFAGDVQANISPCYTCHTNASDIIPEYHEKVDFFKNHKFSAGDNTKNCAICHSNEFCESCHIASGSIEESNIRDDFYTPYSPHRYVNDEKMQTLTRVHDLNYRFTHGIDAKSKTTECQTCHTTETFCVQCHSSQNEDFAADGVVPFSHTQQNFTTFGAGSGGGEHATLAKRDIESCASCHDTYGADPACIRCHTDIHIGKGNDPKTHVTGFMRDERGDWHSDDGSMCYSCHTNVTASTGMHGVGFCGYCHN